MASQESGELILLIIAGSAGMLLMAVAIILFVAFYQKKMLQEQLQRQLLEVDYQRKMIEAEMQSRENERSRLSKEIHDGVGVMLQALRATTYAVAKNASEEDRAELSQQINEITETVRSMAYNLMPASLEKFGLEETLDEFCTRMNRIKPETQFAFHREGSEHRLDNRQQLFLYRMVQEAINNVLRHAEATEVKVVMKWSEDSLALNVADNGKGFDFPTQGNKIHGRHGLGLFSLENRSALLGADLTFAPNIPKGTLLKIYLPLNGKN